MPKAVFPEVGAIVTRKLVPEAPTRGPKESEEAFAERVAFCAPLMHAEIDVEILARDPVLVWSYDLDLAFAAEEKRKLDLEQSGKPVPRGMTIEGTRAIRDAHKRVIVDSVRGARGLVSGKRDLADVKDGEELARLFDGMGLLADVARIARETQSPTPTQSES